MDASPAPSLTVVSHPRCIGLMLHPCVPRNRFLPCSVHADSSPSTAKAAMENTCGLESGWWAQPAASRAKQLQ